MFISSQYKKCVSSVTGPRSVRLFSVVQNIVVMNVHEDGKRLTDDDGDPHRSVAVVTTHKAAHKPGQWKLREQKKKKKIYRTSDLWQIIITGLLTMVPSNLSGWSSIKT